MVSPSTEQMSCPLGPSPIAVAILPSGSLYSLPGVASKSCHAGASSAHDFGSGASHKLLRICWARVSESVVRFVCSFRLVARSVISAGNTV